MDEIQVQKISGAVTLNSFIDPRFKTVRVSVNMLTPLSKETAAPYALLSSLICRATQEYPNYASFSARLAELYGASLNSSVKKMGEYQVLTISAGGIAGRYAFGGEDMFQELTHLIFSVLFQPLRDADGAFPKDGFQQEKRQMLEMKDSEYNDKMVYAHQRCEEILFEGEKAGVNRCGSREDINGLKLSSLTGLWEALLAASRFEIFVLGDCRPDPELFRSYFAEVGKPLPLGALPYREPALVKRVVEEQPLSQSKLSLAFRVDSQPGERLRFLLMNAVFGGTASSKLFRNVREKMSLCYYCSSSFAGQSRALYVESGVETENLQQAETAILDQLRAIQEGQVTEEELLSAKLSLRNSLRAVGDSLRAVENWYLSRTFEGVMQTPSQAVRQLMEYTVEDVVKAAQKLKLGVVYSLKGCVTD